ncbi:MAG: hypothetical protein JW720_02175, partial [Sedimentisphaerales bacterium]|nr:hypothetical protein [Sedimentisphaerales bacterium]
QTAYMKAHWPVEFMAALLTYEMDNTDKVVDYIGECREMGIEVMAPDINESGVDFTPRYVGGEDGKKKEVIRFGLAAVKGVGGKAVEQIIAARQKVGKFESLFHFCENVDLRAANKQVMEALIKAGAFDRLGGGRHQMMAGLEAAMENGASLQVDRANGQMNFFGSAGQTDYSEDEKRLPQVAPWPEAQMLAYEKEVLGFYVTSNPLSHHAETLDIYSTHNSSQLRDGEGVKEVVVGGMIARIRYNLTKNGKNAGAKMAVVVLEDLQGQVEVVLFPRVLKKYGHLIKEDEVVFVEGNLDFRREQPNVLASKVVPLEKIKDEVAVKVRISLEARDVSEAKVAEIRSICEHHKGKSEVFVAVQTAKGRVRTSVDKKLSVDPDEEFCRKMRKVIGKKNLTLSR